MKAKEMRGLLLIPAGALILAAQQPPAATPPLTGGGGGAAAQGAAAQAAQINNLDEVLKRVDDLMWHTLLGDIADIDKVEYTSLPPAHIPNPKAPGAGNPLIIRAYTFIPKKLDRAQKQPLIVFCHQGIHANSDTGDAHVFREPGRDYDPGRSNNTTSERSSRRSRTISWPTREVSKSRTSKSRASWVNCRSVPVCKSIVQRSL